VSTRERKEDPRQLVSFLSDSDAEVVSLVRGRIKREISPAVLREIKDTLPPLERARVRDILSDLDRERSYSALGNLLQFPDHRSLEKGWLLLSSLHHPSAQPEKTTNLLDEWAESLRPSVKNVVGSTQLNCILKFFFSVKKLRGDDKDYYNVQNCFLHTVLATRVGLPISLVSLMMLVLRRLDIPFYGIPYPGHFIGLLRAKEEFFYIDAFSRGKVLSRQHLTDLMEFSDDSVLLDSPAGDIAILKRMIRNLVLIYEKAGQEDKADPLRNLVRGMRFEPSNRDL